MKNILLVLSILIYSVGFSQNSSEKKFDQEIFEYLNTITDKEATSLETFLIYTKPFSKWDVRPLEAKQIKALDSIYSPSQIPNFFWGAFSDKYGLSMEKAMEKPNEFLDKAIENQNKLSNFLKNNTKNFNLLSELILKSSNKYYLNQKEILRIDDVFKEKNSYWSYVVSRDSSYPISAETKINNQIKFTKQQDQILKLLNDLNIYSAVKTSKGIFYLVDGFTDNSYGFYFNSNDQMENDNMLFEIMKSEKITDKYFYYIAN